jgi:hypothetical protein
MAELAVLFWLGVVFSGCGPIAPAQAGPFFPVIQTPTGARTPTPGPLTYTVGAWPSDSTPPPHGTVTIFVSVRNSGVPVQGAAVTVAAFYPGSLAVRAHSVLAGPRSTNRQGYAAVGMPVGSAPSQVGKTQQTVQVTVTVTDQGKFYQATTNFTPLP